MKRIVLLAFIFISSNVFAQNLVYDNDPLLANFGFQVRQIGEFMSRLNGETSISEHTDTTSRELDIASLFKKETYHNNKQFVEDFTQKVLPDARYIDFADTTWYAVAKCAITTKSRDVQDDFVTLILKTEKYGPYLYKWVLAEAYGEILNLLPNKRNPGLRISPTDNEVNFMSLSYISKNENKNILNYTFQNYSPDPLTVFLTLLYNDLIEIDYVKELSYVFNDIEGYCLIVNYYSGDDRNCGWLISDIKPIMKHLNQFSLPYFNIR